MKAMVQDKYAAPDAVPSPKEVAKPSVEDGEILVRVRAATARWVLDLPKPIRFIGRLASLGRPRKVIPGVELAGHVEAVGKNAKRLKPGDEVFGWCKRGALAEYVSVPEDNLEQRPSGLTFEQAAVLPLSGFTALQGLRKRGRIRSGQKVLIIGASGGVGTFAVQIAKALGTEVTGVCSTPNLYLVRSIGVDNVIDYTQDDFSETGQQFDLILDLAADRPLSVYKRALSPKGTLVMAGGAGSTSKHPYLRSIGRLIHAAVLSVFGRQNLRALLISKPHEDLVTIRELVEAGDLTPVISASYPLNETPKAIRHFDEGHARGKVVVTV